VIIFANNYLKPRQLSVTKRCQDREKTCKYKNDLPPTSLAKINVVIVQFIKLSCHRFAFDYLTDSSRVIDAIFYIDPMREIRKIENCKSSLSQIKTPYYAFSPSAAPEKDK